VVSIFEVLEASATMSDHLDRVTEWYPYIRVALRDTPKGTPMLEIGVQNGGSLLQLMALVKDIDPTRQIVSVDVNPAPTGDFMGWCNKLGLQWQHNQMQQNLFISLLHTRPDIPVFAYANFDGNHDQVSCTQDMREFGRYLVKGGVMVKDDVDQWDPLPEFEGFKMLTDIRTQEGTKLGPHGHHVMGWQKL
jgi:Methyltransferase domain